MSREKVVGLGIGAGSGVIAAKSGVGPALWVRPLLACCCGEISSTGRLVAVRPKKRVQPRTDEENHDAATTETGMAEATASCAAVRSIQRASIHTFHNACPWLARPDLCSSNSRRT